MSSATARKQTKATTSGNEIWRMAKWRHDSRHIESSRVESKHIKYLYAAIWQRSTGIKQITRQNASGLKSNQKKKRGKEREKNQSTNFIRIDLSAGGKRVKGKKWLKMATSVIYDMQLIRQMENIRENGSGQANNLGK